MECDAARRAAGSLQALRGARIEAQRVQPLTRRVDEVGVADLQCVDVFLLRTLEHRRIQGEKQLPGLDRLAHRAHGQPLHPTLGASAHLSYAPLVEADVAHDLDALRQAAAHGGCRAHAEVVHHGRRNADLRAGNGREDRHVVHAHLVLLRNRRRTVGIVRVTVVQGRGRTRRGAVTGARGLRRRLLRTRGEQAHRNQPARHAEIIGGVHRSSPAR